MRLIHKFMPPTDEYEEDSFEPFNPIDMTPSGNLYPLGNLMIHCTERTDGFASGKSRCLQSTCVDGKILELKIKRRSQETCVCGV